MAAKLPLISDDEISLLQSALPEVTSVKQSSSADSRAIVIEASSVVLQGSFSLTIEVAKNNSVQRIKVKCSPDDVDPLVAGDFEQFAQHSFDSSRAEEGTTVDASDLTSLILELFQQLLTFDPETSNPLRVAQKSKSNHNDDDDEAGKAVDEDDDGDEDEESEQLFDETTDWAEFSRRQAELKQKRLVREKQRQEGGKPEIEEPQYVAILHMHHIYCCYKKRFILDLARDLGLRGVFKWGLPGRVVVEGGFSDVEFYSRAVRQIRTWKRCTERGIWRSSDECGGPSIFELGFGFVGPCDESEIKAILLERKWADGFRYTFGPSGGPSSN